MIRKKGNLHRKKGLSLAGGILLLLFVLAAADPRMMVRRYSLDAPAVQDSIRIALITDLHSCFYGKNQQHLLQAIAREKPDLVLLGGDIFDDNREDENTCRFLEGLKGKYACYYVPGNHEYWAGREAFAEKMQVLAENDIPVLQGDCRRIQVKGETLLLCGADDPDSFRNPSMNGQLKSMAAQAGQNEYTLLLSHRPEYFPLYVQHGFDLVLCGHAHGGQWRIPGVVNGLFAPDQGFFPDYAGGLYQQQDTVMIVSRGLARESTLIPRIFNRPELVMVDLY